jgi:hypothetical protein
MSDPVLSRQTSTMSAAGVAATAMLFPWSSLQIFATLFFNSSPSVKKIKVQSDNFR